MREITLRRFYGRRPPPAIPEGTVRISCFISQCNAEGVGTGYHSQWDNSEKNDLVERAANLKLYNEKSGIGVESFQRFVYHEQYYGPPSNPNESDRKNDSGSYLGRSEGIEISPDLVQEKYAELKAADVVQNPGWYIRGAVRYNADIHQGGNKNNRQTFNLEVPRHSGESNKEWQKRTMEIAAALQEVQGIHVNGSGKGGKLFAYGDSEGVFSDLVAEQKHWPQMKPTRTR